MLTAPTLSPAIPAILVSLLLATPSGRPPAGPLARAEPRVYDVKFEVMLSTYLPQDVRYRANMDLRDAPIVMPQILQSTWSKVDASSLRAQLWLGSAEDTTLPQRLRTDAGLPHHTHLAVLPVAQFTGQALRWNVTWQVQCWSSRVDDAAAARIAWPQEWPEEVADGLKPQLFIESDAEIFKQSVQRVSQGNLRMVPPYLAAKDLIRYCINEVQISGDGLHRESFGAMRGMHVLGAVRTAQFVNGTKPGPEGPPGPHDLVCICVAMLRAANIPARPVIGIAEDDKGRNRLVSWAEFYLPDAGWVPFDPHTMRGKGIRHRDVRQPWPEFGTMEDLNRRIPLAYHFVPPTGVQSPQYPAVWGWDPRPGGAPTVQQDVSLVVLSRGPGEEDPR